MKKTAAFFNDNRKKVWFALLLNAAALAVLVLLMRPKFESNDEFSLASFYNLCRPGQDIRSLFENVILGSLTAALYRLTTAVPWYTVTQYAALFAGFTAVTWVIMQKFRGRTAMLLFCLMMMTFGREGYIIVSFTKTAGFTAAMGTCLLLYFIEQEKFSLKGSLTAALIILFGAMFRWSAFLSTAAVTAVYGIYLILKLFRKSEKGRWLRQVRVWVLTLLPVAVLVIGTKAVDNAVIRTSPETMHYKEYTALRSRIMDHGFPEYEGNEEAFNAIGINENAWKLYKKWNFYDTEKFSIPVMEKIRDIWDADRRDLSTTVKDFFGVYPRYFFVNRVFPVYLMMLALFFVYGKKNRESVITVVFQLVLLMGLFFYLYWDGRSGLNRVDAGLWMSGCLTLLLLLGESDMDMKPREVFVVLAGVLIMIQTQWRTDYRTETANRRSQMLQYQDVLEGVSADTDHLYLFETGNSIVSYGYGPWDSVPVGLMNNMGGLGGWSTESPLQRKILDSYGVGNPYRDMIGNEKVLIYGDDIDMIVEYLHDYYDDNCYAKEAGEVNGRTVYWIADPDTEETE